eukprot:TRINITY_DN5671_c0_g1_i6.p1 TRINITY_DN5671_c0_g1~~TRINITY_DN5671_c0_g1_i6.p1  ORF type:complete len:324 (+),score=27.64 TRINITY_DN5671_c0_g1_i6:41-1012(+)
MSLKFASNSGFACSPVSKCLAVLVGGFHVASHVPALESFFRKIVTGPDRIDSLNSFSRYLGAKFLFLDTKNTIFCCVIIYLFRILERRYGSLKFASNLIMSCVLSMSTEMLLEQYFETKNFGPLCLVMPLYIPWFREVPVVSASHYGPVSISGKSINYLLCLQLALATKGSLLATLCAFVSGLFVYCTPLKKFSLPGWMGSIFSKTIGRIINTYPSSDTGLMGATLEIQRSQHTEALENQLMRARNRFQVPVNGGGRQLRLDEMWGGLAGAGAAGPAHPNLPVIQSQVQTLVDMGFTRERAETALRQARNNLDEATNILLQDM